MKSVRLSKGTITYREAGQGAPILFVHGVLVDGNLWSEVVPKLAGQHRCIVPDWPIGSHRQAMAPDADLSTAGLADLVLELCDALDLQEVTLVGNDTGGAICQVVAARRPARIARLVLTNCDAFEVFPPKGFGPLFKLAARVPGMIRVISSLLLRFPSLRRLSLAYGALTRKRLSDELLESWVAPGARDKGVRRDTRKVLRGISPSVTLAAAEGLREFQRPALLLWGSDDRFFSLDLGRRLAAQLPKSRMVPVERGATFLPLDRPDAVADEIDRFVLVG
jgi:pimeloyl-ACP methyl ester carboxylesterase